MYQEEELTALRRQIVQRQRLVIIPAVILAAGIAASAIRRSEGIAVALTILLGALLIFAWDLFLKPLRCYEKHMNQMLHGRLHEVEGIWGGMGEDISLVDGVRYHSVTLTCEDEPGKPYERLMYYDAEKERPAVFRGQRVRVTYSDRQIADIRTV